MRVYVSRIDFAYDGGSQIIGVYTDALSAREACVRHMNELPSGGGLTMVWVDRSGDEDCGYSDVAEGRPGGFSLGNFRGAAYAISIHDLDSRE